MTILPNGVAVSGTEHHAEWCKSGLIHDPWMAGIITSHLKSGDIMIEGGAHIGSLTRAALDVGAQVYAFEPNRESRECLTHNCPEAVIFSQALSDETKKVAFHENESATGMSYVSDGDDIAAVSLDQMFAGVLGIRLIKLDVEGQEVKVLRGARDVIADNLPVLIIEVNKWALERAGDSEKELLNLIEDMGYEWRILQPQCKRGDEQYDIEARFPDVLREANANH